MNTIVKIGALIFNQQQQVLAVHKKGKPPLELIVPGGRMEVGENDEQTLRREIREELNSDILTLDFYAEFQAQACYEDQWLIMRTYVVTLNRMPIASHEIDQLVWLDKHYAQSGYQFASILGLQILPRLFLEGKSYAQS